MNQSMALNTVTEAVEALSGPGGSFLVVMIVVLAAYGIHEFTSNGYSRTETKPDGTVITYSKGDSGKA